MYAGLYAVPRIDERRTFVGAIEYFLPARSREFLLGLTVNISDSGLCIKTSASLGVGEIVVIRNKLPVPCKKAAIMWVRKDPKNFYRAGLRFLRDGP